MSNDELITEARQLAGLLPPAEDYTGDIIFRLVRALLDSEAARTALKEDHTKLVSIRTALLVRGGVFEAERDALQEEVARLRAIIDAPLAITGSSLSEQIAAYIASLNKAERDTGKDAD